MCAKVSHGPEQTSSSSRDSRRTSKRKLRPVRTCPLSMIMKVAQTIPETTYMNSSVHRTFPGGSQEDGRTKRQPSQPKLHQNPVRSRPHQREKESQAYDRPSEEILVHPISMFQDYIQPKSASVDDTLIDRWRTGPDLPAKVHV